MPGTILTFPVLIHGEPKLPMASMPRGGLYKPENKILAGRVTKCENERPALRRALADGS